MSGASISVLVWLGEKAALFARQALIVGKAVAKRVLRGFEPGSATDSCCLCNKLEPAEGAFGSCDFGAKLAHAGCSKII